MRGDGLVPAVANALQSGSPPHAWGRLVRHDADLQASRFTPTCVGTAGAARARRLPRAVHPHMRGDGHVSARARAQHNGSPPHAWGRRCPKTRRTIPRRFTPTCVGTATGTLSVTLMYPVHPHMRGDGGAALGHCVPPIGSPPHAWGRPYVDFMVDDLIRFTPTCVGTAGHERESRTAEPVHPHMRGDGGSQEIGSEERRGSPPHAWGRRQIVDIPGDDARFTPTCVGTARADREQEEPDAVHPHMRGDGGVVGGTTVLPSGSPLHAWGRLTLPDVSASTMRFTPTCVGTAPAPRTARLAPAVHPHMRGDGSTPRPARRAGRGSPPHAWGRRNGRGYDGGGIGSPPHAWGRRPR